MSVYSSFTYDGESLSNIIVVRPSQNCMFRLPTIVTISQLCHDILLSEDINNFLIWRKVFVEALFSRAILAPLGVTSLKTI